MAGTAFTTLRVPRRHVVAGQRQTLGEAARQVGTGEEEATESDRVRASGLQCLSPGHRDGLATSCAVASLAGDVARSNARARTACTDQVSAYRDLFVRLMAGARPSPASRARAVAAWATLVGAVSMARAVNDDALSREILRTAADQLKQQLG